MPFSHALILGVARRKIPEDLVVGNAREVRNYLFS